MATLYTGLYSFIHRGCLYTLLQYWKDD